MCPREYPGVFTLGTSYNIASERDCVSIEYLVLHNVFAWFMNKGSQQNVTLPVGADFTYYAEILNMVS